jgi:putative NIF3 family GTP cyclohydrolase 1 type 2
LIVRQFGKNKKMWPKNEKIKKGGQKNEKIKKVAKNGADAYISRDSYRHLRVSPAA